MSAPLTLYLMRHGEVYNPEAILYGRMEGYRLSDNGRQQAQAASDYLVNVSLSAIYSSPMQRAQETATIIAHPHGLNIKVDERINEVHTPFDGTPHSELEKTMFDLYTGNQPPYEQMVDVRTRALAFVQALRKAHAGQKIAMVTHGDIVVTLFLWAKGQNADDMGRGRLQALGLTDVYPATASVSQLTFITHDPDEIPHYSYYCPY